MRWAVVLAIAWTAGSLNLQSADSATAAETLQEAQPIWDRLIADAKVLKLPTKFIEDVPSDFVRFEFDDLRTFAAEYHPEEHRMILNRSLSFNAAGSTLRPLRELTNKDLQTLFHELFHAYMDYLSTRAQSEPHGGSLLEVAHEQRRCRYEHVLITPIPQRKGQTEERFLDETESWEALNETWAVFIGWAVWTQLELARSKRPFDLPAIDTDLWVRRLQKADKEAELRGYYEPRDPAEKAVAQKRYLAPADRISAVEIMILMKEVLGSSTSRIRRSAQVLGKNGPPIASSASCAASAVTQ